MLSKPKALVVDDDQDIRDVFTQLFSDDYIVFSAEDGVEAIKYAIRESPDIILLDIMMPKLDGFQTCEALRKESSLHNTPIIMVSALRDSRERIQAFKVGADDYITKPFDSDELKIRMTARIQRYRELCAGIQAPPKKEGSITCGNLMLDPQTFQVNVSGREVRLGPIEFRLIRYLVENRGRVCAREEILAAVWDSPDRSIRILDAHILALRKKLDGFDHSIVSVYGAGYILKFGNH